MQLAIYGAGGFAREVAGPARVRLKAESASQTDDDAVVFISDRLEEIGTVIDGIRVVSFEDLTGPHHCKRNIVIAIADSSVRREIAARCQAHGLTFLPVLAAPTHVTHQDRRNLGEGAIFCDFTMVTAPNARIGKHFHCNIYSYVAHDCVIGDYVTFAPMVCCNGHVVIEDGAYIGTGAVIRPGSGNDPIVIGKGAVVGMGAVVGKSVPPGAVVVGNPARSIERVSDRT
jgi:sugar O-acyltransferase (sialic acid O-acetyltransferase NeuD family)